MIMQDIYHTDTTLTARDREAQALGYTTRIMVDGGCECGEFLVKPDTDLDGRFKAWGIDWDGWFYITGCNVLIETVEA